MPSKPMTCREVYKEKFATGEGGIDCCCKCPAFGYKGEDECSQLYIFDNGWRAYLCCETIDNLTQLERFKRD